MHESDVEAVVPPSALNGLDAARRGHMSGSSLEVKRLGEAPVQAAARIEADRVFPEQLALAFLRHAVPAEHDIYRLRKRTFSVRII